MLVTLHPSRHIGETSNRVISVTPVLNWAP